MLGVIDLLDEPHKFKYDTQFKVLGNAAPKSKGVKSAADIAIMKEDEEEEPVAVISAEKRIPILVIEYKPKLYSTLENVDLADLCEVIVQAYCVKQGYSHHQVVHLLTDLRDFYYFNIGWRDGKLHLAGYQHVQVDIKSVSSLHSHYKDLQGGLSVIVQQHA